MKVTNVNLWRTVSLLTLLLFGALILGTTLHSYSMSSHHMASKGCPFSLSEPSVCAKNMFDELKDFFLITTSKLFDIAPALLISFVLVLFFVRALHFLKRAFYPPPTLYCVLYSAGILNSKAP